MMERLVRDPLRAAGHIGTAATVILLIAVLGLGAPVGIFVPIGVGGLMLVLHISRRAERENRQYRSD